MIISSCWCFQYAEQNCHEPQRLSGEGREMPGWQNSFTLIILYKVSSGNILAHLHLKKSIKTLYEIHFCFSNFPFFLHSPDSSMFAGKLLPQQLLVSHKPHKQRKLGSCNIGPHPPVSSDAASPVPFQGDSPAAHLIL